MIEDGIRPFRKAPSAADGGAEESCKTLLHRARRYTATPRLRCQKRLDRELPDNQRICGAIHNREKVVASSESHGYLVGSRVGRLSAVGVLRHIGSNPLPPHYVCQKLQYAIFSNEAGAGSALTSRQTCPVCGKLYGDGQTTFETSSDSTGEKVARTLTQLQRRSSGVHKYTESCSEPKTSSGRAR